ncbi:MAG: hypothetical protein HZA04_10655 [Nitrospinae bacterium]|nr:hypothetical protein [Nitrospinota bacterium]
MGFHFPSARTWALCAGAALFTACGGGTHGQVAVGDKNVSVNVSWAEKKSLEKLELQTHKNLPEEQQCVSSRSPFADDVAEIIRAVNPYMETRTDITPPVRAVELRDHPPRAEDRIAVYLCTGMKPRAYTLYRSIYLSGDFIGGLKNSSAAWGGESAYRSALAFVLFHEMGHAALNHSALKLRSADQFDLPQEMEADQFAYDAMAASRISVTGIGLARAANN